LRDWPSFCVAPTTLGCIAALASRSASEFFTPSRWPTTPQAKPSGAEIFSNASIVASYDDVPSMASSSDFRSLSSVSRTLAMPGSMSLLSMDLNLGRPSWMRSGLVIVAALRHTLRFAVAAKLLWKARVTRSSSIKRAAVRRIGAER
jgi:hypothetical protein